MVCGVYTVYTADTVSMSHVELDRGQACLSLLHVRIYPVQHTPLLTVCTSVSVTNWSSSAGLQGSDELKSAAVNQLPVMDLNE